MESQLNIKKFVVLGVAGIILLILLSWFWHYLHTGTIIVTTDGSNNSEGITLSALKDGKSNNTYVKRGSKQLSATVPLGKYIVSVNGKALSVNQTVNLTHHET